MKTVTYIRFALDLKEKEGGGDAQDFWAGEERLLWTEDCATSEIGNLAFRNSHHAKLYFVL